MLLKTKTCHYDALQQWWPYERDKYWHKSRFPFTELLSYDVPYEPSYFVITGRGLYQKYYSKKFL